MTLLETERLVRKISELLQQAGNADAAPKLAGDYAAACHAANLRLQQCEGMIKAGDRHQAIQLAETPPNLLDLVTVLEFRGADEWRALCQQNALPVAERIDARSVQALNDCYAQGITTDHPLYAAYRKAVLNRNDESALQTLQSITRLNPADTNAAAELARLDAKVLTKRLEHLDGMLAGSEPVMVVTAMEAIEAVGFKTPLEGEVWRRASGIRCGYLLGEAEKQKAAGHWMDVLGKLDFIRREQKDLQLEFSAADLRRMETLEEWARGEQEQDRKQREFAMLLAELHFRIQQSEEKDTSARYVKLPELRDDFEALHKVWRGLADFTRPIPDDASAAFRKRSALLEGEIARRTAIRRRSIFAGTAIVLVIGGVTAWLVLGQMKARSFVAELEAAVSQRQARTAERLLEQIRTSQKRLLGREKVSSAVANAESFVARERSLLTNFEAVRSKLPEQLAGTPEAEQLHAIANQLAATRAALAALAPDLKTESEPRVAAFEKQWQQFLSASGTAVNGLFAQWLQDAEKQAALLDYRAPVETTTKHLAALAATVQKLNDCEAGFTNHLALRSDLRQRATAVRAKAGAYSGELKKLDDGRAALQRARTFTDYAAAVRLLASCEFSGATMVTAATVVQNLGAGDEAALRSLLRVTNAATWVFMRKGKTSLIPEVVMPAEQKLLESLNNDPAVNASHQRYRFSMDRENSRVVEWITAGPLDDSIGWKKIKAWLPHPNVTTVNFLEYDYGYFEGKWRLTPGQPQLVQRLEQEPLRDAAAFGESGLGRICPGGNSHQRPALEVLDAIKISQNGSAVCRAYLFLQTVELMEFQPDAWGLSFCPSARAHAARIRALVGGKIDSGDWFVPAKSKDWSAKLEPFFLAEKSVSYVKQASGNLALVQATAKGGFRYIGFIGLDGQPVVTENPAPAEMWGYDAARKQPALISGTGMPLSPLFALPVSRTEYLAKAGVSPEAPTFANALPPLFQETKQP